MMYHFSRKLANRLLLLSLLLATAAPSFAQSRSYDGNRWYEVEMSIFTNQPLNSQAKENSFPEQITLSYPDNIRELSPFSESYQYEFSAVQTTEFEELLLANTQAPILGPDFDSANSSFRLKNPASDPYIALGTKPHQFQRINRDIANSPEHRLLFHAVWRQPMLNKVQASPIFIRGGRQYGNHNELEGSVTFSYNVNRIDIDTQLWLASFTGSTNNSRSVWLLPEQAFQQDQSSQQHYSVDNVVLINETRQMKSNEFHYLDHPDFGVLIEVRPYQLPDVFDFNSDLDLEG